jgi:hypothetical protein
MMARCRSVFDEKSLKSRMTRRSKRRCFAVEAEGWRLRLFVGVRGRKKEKEKKKKQAEMGLSRGKPERGKEEAGGEARGISPGLVS